MTKFEYTDTLARNGSAIASTAVKAAYYNQDDKTLLVVMRENGNAYRYDGVPSWVWGDFKGSSSLGRFFANTIKRSYGPSQYVGVGKNLSVVQKGAAVTPLRPNYSLGTPKGLTYASDAQVTTKAEAFPLSVAPAPAQGVRKATTTVKFDLLGAERFVNFDDKSTVDDALVEFSRIAAMLGVKAAVKSVTVNFE